MVILGKAMVRPLGWWSWGLPLDDFTRLVGIESRDLALGAVALCAF